MIDWVLQTVLAAKDTDSREWLEFLPIIIIAALWALGAILKVIRKQPGQQAQATKDERGSEQRLDLSKLVRLARERYMAAQRPAEQAEPKEPAGAPAVIPKVAPTGREMPPPVPGTGRARKVTERSPLLRPAARPVTQSKQPALRVEMPSVEPDLEVLPEFAMPMTKKLARPAPQPAGEELKEPRLTQILSEYSAPESLKRAILHYEILGKCAAMRQGNGTGMWS